MDLLLFFSSLFVPRVRYAHHLHIRVHAPNNNSCEALDHFTLLHRCDLPLFPMVQFCLTLKLNNNKNNRRHFNVRMQWFSEVKTHSHTYPNTHRRKYNLKNQPNKRWKLRGFLAIPFPRHLQSERDGKVCQPLWSRSLLTHMKFYVCVCLWRIYRKYKFYGHWISLAHKQFIISFRLCCCSRARCSLNSHVIAKRL